MNPRHPDRTALERFSRGHASTTEERWIEDHLRSGCAVCQKEVDALLMITLTSSSFGEPSRDSHVRSACRGIRGRP